MITKAVIVSKEAQRRELMSDWVANRRAEALKARHLHTSERPAAKAATPKFAAAAKRQK